MAGARETSCFGGLKSTFRDRCRRSEQLDVDVQVLWQADSDFVAGVVNRYFWTCARFRNRSRCSTSWSLKCAFRGRAEFVAGALLCGPCGRCTTSWALRCRFCGSGRCSTLWALKCRFRGGWGFASWERSTKYCACHEICTSRSTKHCTCHEICTSGPTKYCTCHEICTSKVHKALHLPPSPPSPPSHQSPSFATSGRRTFLPGFHLCGPAAVELRSLFWVASVEFITIKQLWREETRWCEVA